MLSDAAIIERVEIYRYGLTFAHGTYVMSGGRDIVELPSVVVRVVAGDGQDGFGEVCPLGSTYLPAFGDGAIAALKLLAPAVLGQDVRQAANLAAALDAGLMGHGYAKSAIDIACWDLRGKLYGQSVGTLLGGHIVDSVPLYVAIPLSSPSEMVEYIAQRRAEGVARFQLKVGEDPREDADRVRQVVEASAPGEIFIVDANCGWTLQQAVVASRLLEPLDGVFLEQPCRTLEECLVVRQRTTLPMVLDEVITDVHSLLRAHRHGAMEAINLKISKVGGLTKAKLIRDLCEALGLGMTIEDTWGGDVCTAAISHLAASTQPESLFTTSFMNDWVNEHIAGYAPRSRNGVGSAPSGPGLGISVDLDLLGTPVAAFEVRRHPAETPDPSVPRRAFGDDPQEP